MPIRGGRDNLDNCKFIVNFLIDKGHEVLNKHVIADNVLDRENKLIPKQIHDRDEDWLKESDMVIAEVTNPSLGAGIEIGYAIMLNKKVYALYLSKCEDKISMMIRGSDSIIKLPYNNQAELTEIIQKIIN